MNRDEMPRIVAAIPVQPTDVYRLNAGEDGEPPEAERLIGVAIDTDGTAHSIVLDAGCPHVVLDDITVDTIEQTIWYHRRARAGRGAA